MNIKPIRDVLVCLALAAFLAVLIQTALAVRSVNVTVAALPAELAGIHQDLTSQLSRVLDGDPRSLDIQDKIPMRALVLTFLNTQIRGLRNDTSKQLTAIERNAMTAIREQGGALNGQISQTLKITDSRLGQALKITDSRTGQALDQVAELRADLEPAIAGLGATSTKLADITAHIDDALPPFTDCAYFDAFGEPVGGNPDCLFNRVQGVSKATEQSMQAIAKAAPELTQHVTGITADFHDATHNLDIKYFHPPPMNKKQKVARFFSNFEAIVIALARGGAF